MERKCSITDRLSFYSNSLLWNWCDCWILPSRSRYRWWQWFPISNQDLACYRHRYQHWLPLRLGMYMYSSFRETNKPEYFGYLSHPNYLWFSNCWSNQYFSWIFLDWYAMQRRMRGRMPICYLYQIWSFHRLVLLQWKDICPLGHNWYGRNQIIMCFYSFRYLVCPIVHRHLNCYIRIRHW